MLAGKAGEKECPGGRLPLNAGELEALINKACRPPPLLYFQERDDISCEPSSCVKCSQAFKNIPSI